MMTKPEQAVNCFKTKLNCCQSILLPFLNKTLMDNRTARMLSTLFGSGMQNGSTCGAVTGAYMVIGLHFGMEHDTDTKAKIQSIEMADVFNNTFIAKHESLECKNLIGCDLSSDEGKKYAHDNNLFTTLCPAFVETSAKILNDLIN